MHHRSDINVSLLNLQHPERPSEIVVHINSSSNRPEASPLEDHGEYKRLISIESKFEEAIAPTRDIHNGLNLFFLLLLLSGVAFTGLKIAGTASEEMDFTPLAIMCTLMGGLCLCFGYCTRSRDYRREIEEKTEADFKTHLNEMAVSLGFEEKNADPLLVLSSIKEAKTTIESQSRSKLMFFCGKLSGQTTPLGRFFNGGSGYTESGLHGDSLTGLCEEIFTFACLNDFSERIKRREKLKDQLELLAKTDYDTAGQHNFFRRLNKPPIENGRPIYNETKIIKKIFSYLGS